MKEYDMTLPEAALEERWDALSKKQKDKYTQKHQKELQDYVVDFENFIRVLDFIASFKQSPSFIRFHFRVYQVET